SVRRAEVAARRVVREEAIGRARRATSRAGFRDVTRARHGPAHGPRGTRRVGTDAGAVADVVRAGVPVVTARNERGRFTWLVGFVARGVPVGRRYARISCMPRTVAGLARVGAVAEDAVVACRAVGLELPDTPPDVVAMIAVRALVAVEARRSLPHELAVELAAAEREVAVGAPSALGARRARGQRRIAVAVELAAGVALLPALDDSVAAGAGSPGESGRKNRTIQ